MIVSYLPKHPSAWLHLEEQWNNYNYYENLRQDLCEKNVRFVQTCDIYYNKLHFQFDTFILNIWIQMLLASAEQYPSS